MELRSKMTRVVHCSVSIPDGSNIDVTVSAKADGREILEKVCEELGVLETDYFALVYTGNRGEELWLNLRNRVDSELSDSSPHRLALSVKFYIKPHMIQQSTTRRLFYLNVRQCFLTERLRAPSLAQRAYMSALIAQADLGDRPSPTIPHLPPLDPPDQSEIISGTSSLLSVVPYSPDSRTTEFLALIDEQYRLLRGSSKDSAQYRLLQEASKLDSYGMQCYVANDPSSGQSLSVGVGPDGIVLHDDKWNVVKSITYQSIQSVTHDGRNLVLDTLDDSMPDQGGGGGTVTRTFRLISYRAANALYRAMTEIYSFYRCDTVCSDVSTQFSRDLKGTLASLFNENTDLGKRYVFDIERTFHESYDRVRRILYLQQHPTIAGFTASQNNTVDENNMAGRFINTGNANNAGYAEGAIDVQFPAAAVSDTTLSQTSAMEWGVVAEEGREGKAGGLPLGEQPAGVMEESAVKSTAVIAALPPCNCQMLSEVVQRLNDSLTCHICADTDINTTFVPCGHVVSCMQCAVRLSCCPLCKADIVNIQHVFLPCLKQDCTLPLTTATTTTTVAATTTASTTIAVATSTAMTTIDTEILTSDSNGL